MSEFSNRKIKIFSKILNDFIKNYNETVSRNDKKLKSLKLKDQTVLKTFKEECDFIFEDFEKCNINCFERLSLCKKFNLDVSDNSESLWEYLHLLYLCTLKDKNLELTESLREKRKVAFAPKEGINSLVSAISKKINVDNEDLKDFDPMILMNALMKGESLENIQIGNINFGDILKETTSMIEAKVNSGEMDLENLKNEAQGLLQQTQKQ